MSQLTTWIQVVTSPWCLDFSFTGLLESSTPRAKVPCSHSSMELSLPWGAKVHGTYSSRGTFTQRNVRSVSKSYCGPNVLGTFVPKGAKVPREWEFQRTDIPSVELSLTWSKRPGNERKLRESSPLQMGICRSLKWIWHLRNYLQDYRNAKVIHLGCLTAVVPDLFWMTDYPTYLS